MEWQNTITGDVKGRKGKLLLVRMSEYLPEGVFSRLGFLELAGVLGEDAEQVFLEGLKSPTVAVGETVLPVDRPTQHKKFITGPLVGRKAQLENGLDAIREKTAGGDSFGFYGLRGMGGVGKSRLAAEIAGADTRPR